MAAYLWKISQWKKKLNSIYQQQVIIDKFWVKFPRFLYIYIIIIATHYVIKKSDLLTENIVESNES